MIFVQLTKTFQNLPKPSNFGQKRTGRLDFGQKGVPLWSERAR